MQWGGAQSTVNKNQEKFDIKAFNLGLVTLVLLLEQCATTCYYKCNLFFLRSNNSVHLLKIYPPCIKVRNSSVFT